MLNFSTVCTYSVVGKPRDVPFVSGVKEDRASFVPVFRGDQVTLQKGSIGLEIEVVQLWNCLKWKNYSEDSSPATIVCCAIWSRHAMLLCTVLSLFRYWLAIWRTGEVPVT